MAYLTTKTLLAAIKSALEALTLEGSTTRLFELVEYYDSQRLGEALEKLIIVKQRVCFVVPSSDAYENVISGRIAVSTRTTEIDLLIADRDWLSGQEAVFGGTSTDKPGILAMKDIVVSALAGQPLALEGVSMLPIGGSPITLREQEAKDTPGRECWVQTFETRAGSTRVAIA